MQAKKAANLRRAWGEKPCEHPAFEKEYILGAQTGDYICTQCGECFSPADRAELAEKIKVTKPDRRQ